MEFKNLDNITYKTNLFGKKVPQMSMLSRIGFLPTSIWETDWNRVKQLKAIVGDKGQTRNVKGSTTFGADVGASIFNPDLAQKILSAYCPLNAKILDQFGGGGTRGIIATAMGFDYTGVELRQEEVDRINQRMNELDKHFKLICGDSCVTTFDKETFDFSFTCPPYYDLEIYSNNEKDLSNLGTYDEFLLGMKKVLKINYDALKPGSFSIWVVGNFRDKKGDLTHYSGDLIRLAKEVGFHLHDELIFHGASGAANQRVGNFEKNRKSVRIHEYIIVLKK